MPVEIKELVIQGRTKDPGDSTTTIDDQNIDQLKQEIVSAVLEELQINVAVHLQGFAEQIIDQALERMEERLKQHRRR